MELDFLACHCTALELAQRCSSQYAQVILFGGFGSERVGKVHATECATPRWFSVRVEERACGVRSVRAVRSTVTRKYIPKSYTALGWLLVNVEERPSELCSIL